MADPTGNPLRQFLGRNRSGSVEPLESLHSATETLDVGLRQQPVSGKDPVAKESKSQRPRKDH
jgi:hypothetical protein